VFCPKLPQCMQLSRQKNLAQAAVCKGLFTRQRISVSHDTFRHK
jgi:hypothetical protein